MDSRRPASWGGQPVGPGSGARQWGPAVGPGSGARQWGPAHGKRGSMSGVVIGLLATDANITNSLITVLADPTWLMRHSRW